MVFFNFKNKKVLVMGLGLHGGGVALTQWLLKHGAKVTVTDLKTAAQLKDSLQKFSGSQLKKIKLVLGKHNLVDFQLSDLIIQNPGVSRESKFLKVARQAGIPIVNDASIFFALCPASIIGVTGTRGKSTTSSLIYRLLNQADKKVANKVWLAGLPQKSMLSILDQIKPNDVVIVELSSWQLEILAEHKFSPFISVLTNIYPDHLNRYAGMNDYIAAKANIFLNQDQADYSIINFDNALSRKVGRRVPVKRFWFSQRRLTDQNACFIRNQKIFFRLDGMRRKLINLSDIKLLGQHNLENALAALTVAGLYNLSVQQIKKGLKQFRNLPGRLEEVRLFKKIKFVNDTTATTPDATIAALKSLAKSTAKNIILMAGGSAKNIPAAKYLELAQWIKKTCRAVVLFVGPSSKQIESALNKVKFNRTKIIGIRSMADSIGVACSLARTQDVILLSPASASFNMFVNEYDRGDQFVELVKKIK